MRSLGKLLLWLLAIPLLFLLSGIIYEGVNSGAHGFRLTVEIATPQGVRSGASVIHVACHGKAKWLPQSPGAICHVFGQAIFVDLGQGKNIIALMAFGPNGSEERMSDLAAKAFGRENAFWHLEAPNWVGSVELYGALMPTLVTFGNLEEPTSARVVATTNADFARAFGPGYHLGRVMLEMVPIGPWPLDRLGLWGTPVTRGIEKTLPWWGQPGRPAAKAWRAWLAGGKAGGSIEPEILFTR